MRYLRAWPLLAGSILLIIGVAVGVCYELKLLPLLVVFGIIACILALVLYLQESDWQWMPIAVLVIIFGSGFALFRVWLLPDHPTVQTYTSIPATIVSVPERQGNYLNFYLDLSEPPLRVITRVKTAQELVYGDKLRLSGEIAELEPKSDFNERGFYRAHATQAKFQASSLEVIQHRQGNWLLGQIYELREIILARLNEAVNPPENQVVAGILLGVKADFSKQLEDAFRATGTTHILVASGSNVIIIAYIIEKLLAWADRRLRIASIVAILGGFIILSGADASVIRASIFYSLFILAQLVGRRPHAPTLIFFVALLMLLLNPWLVAYDVAFQLSFAAVLGLFTFAIWFASFIPTWFGKTFLAPTLAAQLTTLPVIAYHFGEVSLLAPLANLLVLPFVPLVMAGGAISIILPWILVNNWFTEGAATIIILTINWFAKLPFATWQFSHQSTLVAALLTFVIIGLLVVKYRSGYKEEIEAELAQ
jgi:competence protein ComEC